MTHRFVFYSVDSNLLLLLFCLIFILSQIWQWEPLQIGSCILCQKPYRLGLHPLSYPHFLSRIRYFRFILYFLLLPSALESALSPRSNGPFLWRMVFRNQYQMWSMLWWAIILRSFQNRNWGQIYMYVYTYMYMYIFHPRISNSNLVTEFILILSFAIVETLIWQKKLWLSLSLIYLFDHSQSSVAIAEHPLPAPWMPAWPPVPHARLPQHSPHW